MHNYTFKITPRLKLLADHAVRHHGVQQVPYTGPAWDCPVEKPDKPALMLVKDQGAYLMSMFTIEGAGKDGRLEEPDPKDVTKTRLVVCYAEGHDPEKDEDFWEGGDDFGQELPGVAEMILKAPEGSELNVRITSREVTFRIVAPVRRPRIKV